VEAENSSSDAFDDHDRYVVGLTLTMSELVQGFQKFALQMVGTASGLCQDNLPYRFLAKHVALSILSYSKIVTAPCRGEPD
jgi:hypothetical protein